MSGRKNDKAAIRRLNILTLYKDKTVKGISLASMLFYAFWALWNVYYYYALDQQSSCDIGIVVAILSTWWIVLALRYRNYDLLEE